MADPDLQIRGWEGGCGHPDPEIGGQMVSKKFSWASVWSKIKGGGGWRGGPFPWIRHCNQSGDFVCGSSRGLIRVTL